MLLADGGDLNPTMIVRYQAYLERSRQRARPGVGHLACTGRDCRPASSPAKRRRSVERRSSRGHAPSGRSIRWWPARFSASRSRSWPTRRGSMASCSVGADKLWQARARTRRRPAERRRRGGWLMPIWKRCGRCFTAPTRRRIVAGARSACWNCCPIGRRRWSEPSCSRRSRIGGPRAPRRRRGRWCWKSCPRRFEPHIFLRGNPNQLGEAVPRRFLRVLSDGEAAGISQHGSGRLELARAIVDPANPLTARVLVNRVWLHHFGAALVAHAQRFRHAQRSPPTHPELLDHLASGVRRAAAGRSRLHRQIVLSAAYQQASDDRPACHADRPGERAGCGR